jgi:hypothetical protein
MGGSMVTDVMQAVNQTTSRRAPALPERTDDAHRRLHVLARASQRQHEMPHAQGRPLRLSPGRRLELGARCPEHGEIGCGITTHQCCGNCLPAVQPHPDVVIPLDSVMRRDNDPIA